jgi:uncharacterized phage-associated protein
MKTNALSVANYLVDLSKEGERFHLIGLIKRVYIVHGFSLALYNKPAIDDRFDCVEAWKYGPVIPSVYHSFKYNKNNKIENPVEIIEWGDDGDFQFVAPQLKDNDIMEVCKMVFKRYRKTTDSDMIKLTHLSGTPWGLCYVAEQNNQIPDDLTKRYYLKIVEASTSRNN